MNNELLQEEKVHRSVGECLREAREKMGLTSQDVAGRLCLKVSTVSDIEENCFSPELSVTFWRGYIRSYARLVHLPEEPLLSALEQQASEGTLKEMPLAQKKKRKHRGRKRSSDGVLLIITCLVGVALLGISGAWWWQNYLATRQALVPVPSQESTPLQEKAFPEPRQTEDSRPADPSTPVSSNMIDGEPTEQISLPPVQAAAPFSTTNEKNTEAASPLAESAPYQTTVPAGEAEETPQLAHETTPSADLFARSEQQIGTETPVKVQGVSEPVEANVHDIPHEAQNMAPPPQQDLEIRFMANCWIEVRDATGAKRFSGLRRRGETLTLSGNTPYRVRVGAPAAAQIKYRGKIVDLTGFIQSGQVANVTLGAP